MPTVAEQLRLGREAMKMEVQQVAEATKLKSDQIRALEEGRYDYFTAPIYLRGSVRTYAKLLKLDGPKLVAHLDTELGSSKKFAEELPAPARKLTSTLAVIATSSCTFKTVYLRPTTSIRFRVIGTKLERDISTS